MTDDDAPASGEEQQDPNQYDALLRAMESGLLITINEGSGTPSDELRVEYSYSEKTEVGLVGRGQDWMITRDNGELVYGRCDEFGLSEQYDVVTIEVIGIDG